MREILFRGKRTDNGEWIEGYYSAIIDDYSGEEDCVIFPLGDTRINGDGAVEDYCFVIPETVGQFTGVTDKDGCKIFEGDIIRTTNPYTGEEYVGVVEWGCYYAFGVGFVIVWNTDNDLNPSLFYWVSDVGVEVVGNAYDNPELLENNTGKEKSI